MLTPRSRRCEGSQRRVSRVLFDESCGQNITDSKEAVGDVYLMG